MADLRAFIFIDQLQPQTLAYLSTWMKGSLPRQNMAAQVIEIAPGLDVEVLTDIALKCADVRVGLLVVERQFGTIEFHSKSTAEVKIAGQAVLDALGASDKNPMPPKILASKIVTHIDSQHAFLVNRNKLGSMVLGGDSLYLLECQSASYAILACNEAEKAANIRVIDYRMVGANGRLYLAGDEAEVRNAREAAESAFRAVGGGN